MGTSNRPRLSVYRSLKHIYGQLTDDQSGLTLLSISTLSPDIRNSIKSGSNIAAAKVVGKHLAEQALQKGIKQVVFDRGAFPYHGRIKAVAETVRESGLKL